MFFCVEKKYLLFCQRKRKWKRKKRALFISKVILFFRIQKENFFVVFLLEIDIDPRKEKKKEEKRKDLKILHMMIF